MPSEIITIKAKYGDIARVISNIRKLTEDESEAVSLMACLGYALILQRPNIKADVLTEAITHASNWLAFYLENLDGIPKEKIN